MQNEFESLVTILQLIGVIAVCISLIILVYRLIIYKDNADKRAMLMEGFTRILIGVIIIGSLMAIVGFLYKYLVDLSSVNGAGTLNQSKLSLDIAKMSEDDEGILLGMITNVIGAIADAAMSLLGVHTINELIVPTNVEIFSSAQWAGIEFLYSTLVGLSLALMAIMVFKTGITFIRSSINPRDVEIAKEDLLRWVFVIILVSCGLIFSKGIIQLGNLMTEILNDSLKGIFPDFNVLGEVDTGSLFENVIIKLYYTWITVKVNVLFIIRDWTLGTFIIFTPIAATLWGINKNVNAFAVWFGEIITNAFMATFMSLTFMIFVAIMNTDDRKLASSLLFVVVGLSMTLKLASVLRNTLQGLFTKLSGINEDAIANKVTLGGLAGGVGKGISNFKRGMAGTKNMWENLNNAAGKGEKANTFEAQTSKVGSNAMGADKMTNANGFNLADLTSTDEKGNTEISKGATRADFLRNVGNEKYKTKLRNGFGNNEKSIMGAEDKTINKMAKSIDSQVKEGRYLGSEIPEDIINNDNKRALWARKEAENTFYKDVFGVDNYNPKEKDGTFKEGINQSAENDVERIRKQYQNGNFSNLDSMINKEKFEHLSENPPSKMSAGGSYGATYRGTDVKSEGRSSLNERPTQTQRPMPNSETGGNINIEETGSSISSEQSRPTQRPISNSSTTGNIDIEGTSSSLTGKQETSLDKHNSEIGNVNVTNNRSNISLNNNDLQDS